ncbi:hypothetical protein MXF20_18000, partial [Pantoea dispersa]|uniref:hypothetical protein n=1 Tax=Pantoea dispersa TaxID=59814 RepID=UPI002DBDBACB
RFPPSESNTFFSVFLRRGESLHALLSRLRCRFAVSVVAHYRDPDFLHNPFFRSFLSTGEFSLFSLRSRAIRAKISLFTRALSRRLTENIMKGEIACL